MIVYKPIFRLLLFFVLVILILSCSPLDQTIIPAMPIPNATATPFPTDTISAAPSSAPGVSPTLEEIPDTGWHVIQPGLERRVIHIYNDQAEWVESLYIFRLDQNQFRLDVAYHEMPQSLENWQTETNAFIVLNGGYFRIENEKYLPNGLTIVNGQAFGSSYEPFAGMLAIRESSAELRWLAEQPYNLNEPLLAALQSFPVLVKPGGELGFDEVHEDHVKARRTVIAQDKNGQILLILAPRGDFTLHQLSLSLTESDLNLDIAINLDGGPSTGILVADPYEIIPSLTLLPIVIAVYPR